MLRQVRLRAMCTEQRSATRLEKEGAIKKVGKRRFLRVEMRGRAALSGSRSCVTLYAVLSSEGWLCDEVAAWARLLALGIECRVFAWMRVVEKREEGCREMQKAESTSKGRLS